MSSAHSVEFLREKARRLRVHSLRSTSAAGSGHPTSCLSAADIVATLFFHVMRYDPHHPSHPNNDRFVLSKGHAAPLLYAAWAEAGVIPVEQLLTLRRFDSALEGHPTPRFPWARVATGSLGQGLSIGVGMALNGKLERAEYRVYVLLGDGETAEGSVWEAAALAAHYGLDNLIGIIDVNALGQSDRTMYQFDVDSYCRRFGAFGWHAIGIDGHNVEQIVSALEESKKVQGRPVMIAARTLKGKGVSFVEDQEGWHGKALKKNELERALAELEGHARLAIGEPEVGMPAKSPAAPHRPVGEPSLPRYELGQEVATREAYGAALAKLGREHPLVVALDGDVKNSTYAEKFQAACPDRFFEGFIAEQNMVGAAVGLASCGKIPFVSTFAAFLTRAFDHIRMAAISGANIKFAGSHCGVSIGEDGPSQMGLEDLAMMRAIPHSAVLYPSDAVSAEMLVRAAAEHAGIVYIRLTRPKTPVIYGNTERFPIGGCKILRSSGKDDVTVVTAGVTVHESLKAYQALRSQGISLRVIDAYSVKPLDAATIVRAGRDTNNLIICVEDHYWEGGLGDAVLNAVAAEGIGVHKMAIADVPRSGKPEELLHAYGISAECIVDKVKKLLAQRPVAPAAP